MAPQPEAAKEILYQDDPHTRQRAVDHVHVAVKPQPPVVEEVPERRCAGGTGGIRRGGGHQGDVPEPRLSVKSKQRGLFLRGRPFCFA